MVMNIDNLILPSYRKFEFFFNLVFAVAVACLFYSVNMTWSYAFIADCNS